MKSLFIAAAIPLAFVLLGHAHAWGQRIEGEQSSFAVEEIPDEPRIKHPIPVPDAVVEVLKSDDGVKSCLKDNPLAPGQLMSSWFIGSVIHLDGPKEADLVVVPSFHGQESMCFQTPAGFGLFWVFRQNGAGYDLVLRSWAGGLRILTSETNGYRNVRTDSMGQAGRVLTNVVFQFNGNRYVENREATRKQR
jgi:hypothetical protein